MAWGLTGPRPGIDSGAAPLLCRYCYDLVNTVVRTVAPRHRVPVAYLGISWHKSA